MISPSSGPQNNSSAKTEETQRLSETRYRRLVENSPDSIFVNWDDQIVFANEAAVRLLGATRPEQLLGLDLLERIRADFRKALAEERIKAIAADRATPSIELVLVRLDGSEVSVEAMAIPCTHSGRSEMQIVMRDITERKRAEADGLRFSRQMRLLLESAGEGIYGIDLSGRCTFVNQAGAEMIGYAPGEVVGQEMHELTRSPLDHVQGVAFDDTPVMSTLRDGQRHRAHSEVFRRRDGSSFPVEYSSNPVIENGAITGAVITFSDVTDKNRFKAQFLRSQRMEAIGTLASGIAHDLNNALAPILMAADLLQTDCVDARQKRLLEMIRASTERGAEMVRQVLTFARGTEGDRKIVPIKTLVREVVDISRHTFPKTIEIRAEIAANAWSLVGNITQLHQVLLNLCVNARDAMPDGGTLTIAVANTYLDKSCGRISPDAKPGPYVTLAAIDTGIGIPPEVQARIFDPFFTTKSPDKGTGLGLSNVLAIVKSHCGFVTVTSTVGAGTSVKIWLPGQIVEGEAPAKEDHPAMPMGKGETILVVDDEAAIRNIASQTLEMSGYRVLTAADGAQAIALCASHQDSLQLMITDMAMPIMDGPAAIRTARKILPRMRIIATTGLDAQSRATSEVRHNAHACLQKPYSADELLQSVHDVLHAKP